MRVHTTEATDIDDPSNPDENENENHLEELKDDAEIQDIQDGPQEADHSRPHTVIDNTSLHINSPEVMRPDVPQTPTS